MLNADTISTSHAAFLHQLSQDSELRSSLVMNPYETLKAHGIDMDPQAVPDNVVLPSPEELHTAVLSATDEEAIADVRRFAGFFGNN